MYGVTLVYILLTIDLGVIGKVEVAHYLIKYVPTHRRAYRFASHIRVVFPVHSTAWQLGDA